MRITILGKLPTLNEYLGAYGKNRYMAGSLKKKATEDVMWQVKGMKKITSPATYTFNWFVANKRSDPDNVASAVKYIFDGLVGAGKLPNDTMEYVLAIDHRFEVDKSNPRVEVEIIEYA